MGNESTEESRKEISSKPGAPSPPANATTFCFQPFRFKDNPHSRSQLFRLGVTAIFSRHNAREERKKVTPSAFRTISLADSLWVLEQWRGHSAQLLRKRRAVEVVHENLHQCRSVKIRKPRY